MRILIVAATAAEVAPAKEFLDHLGLADSNDIYSLKELKIQFLYTGPGPVATTFHLTSKLLKYPQDLVIQAGIAGAYDASIPLGTVVEVMSEAFGDLGAEDQEKQLDLFEMGFANAHEFPFTNGRLLNKAYDYSFLKKPKKVTGLTVSLSSGKETTIARRRNIYEAEVESMEGAAAFFTAFQINQPIIQLRSISNLVAPRNRDNWNIPLAITNLNQVLIEAINELSKD